MPDDGSEIVVDVPIATSSAIASTIARPGCAPPLGPIAAEGFARVVIAGNDAQVDVGFAGGRDAFPRGIQFSEVDCEGLYDRRIPCAMQPDDSPIPINLRCGKEIPLLFYASDVNTAASSIPIRFRKRIDLSTTPCRAN